MNSLWTTLLFIPALGNAVTSKVYQPATRQSQMPIATRQFPTPTLSKVLTAVSEPLDLPTESLIKDLKLPHPDAWYRTETDLKTLGASPLELSEAAISLGMIAEDAVSFDGNGRARYEKAQDAISTGLDKFTDIVGDARTRKAKLWAHFWTHGYLAPSQVKFDIRSTPLSDGEHYDIQFGQFSENGQVRRLRAYLTEREVNSFLGFLLQNPSMTQEQKEYLISKLGTSQLSAPVEPIDRDNLSELVYSVIAETLGMPRERFLEAVQRSGAMPGSASWKNVESSLPPLREIEKEIVSAAINLAVNTFSGFNPHSHTPGLLRLAASLSEFHREVWKRENGKFLNWRYAWRAEMPWAADINVDEADYALSRDGRDLLINLGYYNHLNKQVPLKFNIPLFPWQPQRVEKFFDVLIGKLSTLGDQDRYVQVAVLRDRVFADIAPKATR